MITVPDLERFPGNGDINEVHTLAGIGTVTTSWEMVEFEHSRLFSAGMGHIDGSVIPFYGYQGMIFRDRFAMLKIAVDHHFMVAPNQALEGKFDELAEVTAKFAAKRNDVAHSVVFDLSKTFFLKDVDNGQPENFYAIPPLYAFSRRDAVKDGRMPFAYTSAQLGELAASMAMLRFEWRQFRHEMYPGEWPEEPRVP